MTRTCLPFALLLALGACGAPARDAGPGARLPEAVRAAAAPFQDLSVVELRPTDGCYWYRHRGPVETTFLPLRTREGRPICARPQPPLGPPSAPDQLAAPIDSSAG